MSSFVGRLRTELESRLTGLTGHTEAPVTARGSAIDERSLPRAFLWIESDPVTLTTKDDESGRGTEYHALAFQCGVTARNSTRLSVMDETVAQIRSRMWPPFEGHEIRFRGTDYEDEILTFGRPFVSAVINFTIDFTTPEGDAG